MVNPVSRSEPLSDQVYASIENMIVSGELAPGERLVESEIAQRLGVSRNPVREAFAALARVGWVEAREQRPGLHVREQSLADADDCFRVRALLEAESARLAARRLRAQGPAPFSATLDLLQGLLDSAQTRIRAADHAALVAANSEFHTHFATLAGTPLLARLIAQVDRKVRWYFAPVALLRAPDSWREHAELLDAVRRGSEEDAAAVMVRHVDNTATAYRTCRVTAPEQDRT